MKMSIRKSFVDWSIDTDILKEEERDNFEYGLKQGLTILLNVFTVVIIGLIFGMLWQSIVFLIAYIPLRSYAGGYHAKTQLNCYLLSVLMIVLILMAMKFLLWTRLMILMVLMLSGSIVLALAPVEDKNKPLDSLEETIFKIRSRRILFIQCLIAVVAYLSGYETLAVSLSISITAVGIMLIFGKISLRCSENQRLAD